MDPKGDRIRKIQSGQLKLPESVLKSNNILLTETAPVRDGVSCLEGGPRPRPVIHDGSSVVTATNPIMLPSAKSVDMGDIPLPGKPDMSAIPLPVSNMNNIPLPEMRHENIPLPSNDSIPLPPETCVLTTAVPSDRRKIRVSLEHLETRGDELLCRSCVMKFSKQLDYDLHLQSDAHQQAIKLDFGDGRGASVSLLNQRTDKKSPSHDGKSGHVSFSFKKNIGSRITNTQPFRRDDKQRASPEIRLLQPETSPKTPVTDTVTTAMADIAEEKSVNVERKISECEVEEKVEKVRLPVLSTFAKVQSKDENGKVLDWPTEMIKYTVTEPKLMYSCNPLTFDFSTLFNSKSKKSPGQSDIGTGVVNEDNENATDKKDELAKTEENAEEPSEEKKKSHKKKKKKKHKKSSEKVENEESQKADNDESKEKSDKPGDEMNTSTLSSGKKKKKKHKKKDEKDADKEDKAGEKTGETEEKKKSKKSRKKTSKQSEGEGEEDRKSKKKKKKSKKHKKKKTENGQSDPESKAKAESESEKESDDEKEKDSSKKKKKKKRKHKRRDVTNHESSDSETENKNVVKEESNLLAVCADASFKRKFPAADSDPDNDKLVAAKLQALSRNKVAQKQQIATTSMTLSVAKKIKKEPVETLGPVVGKLNSSERKRLNSESSVNENTPMKKSKLTPKAPGVRDNIPVATIAPVSNVNVKEEKEESWSKIETLTNDNVKSKWDTSESDMDNALDETVKKDKVLKKHLPPKTHAKQTISKELKSPLGKTRIRADNEHKKSIQPHATQLVHTKKSSQRSDKSRKTSKSPASSHSRSRSKHRSYSRSGSSSRSRSYSSSSYYSDYSRHSRRRGRSSSRSYSGSSSRSRSRSYRHRSSSYSDYSRSRSYSSSRSRSRSHRRRRKRSYTRSRTRSYSSSSYSSGHSRSRNRSRKSRRKNRNRKRRSSVRSLSVSSMDKKSSKKVKQSEEKAKDTEKTKSVPGTLDIPLPDLSGKKDDERTEEKLLKLKDKKRRTDVGETVAKLVESLPADIPLPFSEGDSKTVSSDSLPHGSPKEAPKETDSGFIGPKMPGPPPPPPMGGQRFPPNHGPPGPPRPYGPGQWDHWDHSGWEMPGPWDGPGPGGPGPGPRPFRGMRPYDPRWNGPFDPRRRGPPPHFMNRPRGPPPYGMGPRYPGPRGPHPDYPPDYDYEGHYDGHYNADYNHSESKEDAVKKNKTPPPLPKEPPKTESPKPPLPKKKETKKEPEQNPDIVIPPEQVEQYKLLQKQAAKHARRQLRRQAKKELGEPDDSTSSESEPEEQVPQAETPTAEEVAVLEETAQAQMVALPQQVVLAQAQPASSPTGAYVIVSGGQQFIMQRSMVQAGVPIQAGQPVMAQNASVMATAAAAAAGAHPAHLVQQVPVQQTMLSAGGVPVALASSAHLQQIHHAQQLQQLQHLQQLQQIQQIQAHNQAVAMAAAASQGPILVGNQILVPRIVRPAL